MAVAPDASGGLGSYASDLKGVLTGALNQVAAPALGRLLGIGDLRTYVDADGNVVNAATPSKVTLANQVSTLLKNPLVVLGGVALLVGVVVLIVRR